jgi:hypothetical protein
LLMEKVAKSAWWNVKFGWRMKGVKGILLLAKLNSLIKHSKVIMCIMVRLEVTINTSIYVDPTKVISFPIAYNL